MDVLGYVFLLPVSGIEYGYRPFLLCILLSLLYRLAVQGKFKVGSNFNMTLLRLPY